MKKKIISALLAALTVAVLLSLFAVLPSAADMTYPSDYVDPDEYIVDVDNQLTESEKQEIAKIFRDAVAAANGGCNLVLYYYNYIGYYHTEQQFYRYGIIDKPANVMMIEITREPNEYTYEIHTFGDTSRIKSSEYNIMNNKVHDAVKNGNIVEACRIFAPLAERAFTGKITNWLKVILISAIIALVITGIVAGVIIYGYKKKLKSEIYPLSKYASLELTGQSDVLTGTVVTKRQIQSSSSSGGGGGGGGRSGGGGHSSGGRH